ncbi:MAG: hypothetical protein PHU25_09305 [Deltaproteobacteria bacterium]|nr:hypothetical protein [Deltaproteobacteria bacterium]
MIDEVISLLRAQARGRRVTVAVFCRGNPALVARVAAEGHPTLVVGDRFGPLHAAFGLVPREPGDGLVFAEARLDALPVAPGSVDVVILSMGLPSRVAPASAISLFMDLVKPGGLVVWPHPASDTARGRLGTMLVPWRPGMARAVPRHEQSALAMRCGLSNVAQIAAARPFFPWVITWGRVGPRPWLKKVGHGLSGPNIVES